MVSLAFKQWTLRWGELQDLIGRAPEAFARHGIRLAPHGTTYTFSSKGKTWTQRAIDGVPDKETLRNEDWGRRFYLAGLEPEAVAAAARRRSRTSPSSSRPCARSTAGRRTSIPSRTRAARRARQQPSRVRRRRRSTRARAGEGAARHRRGRLPRIFVAEIVAAYEAREHDAEKGRRWTAKIMRR